MSINKEICNVIQKTKKKLLKLSPYTWEHCRRVSAISQLIAKEIGLNKEDIKTIKNGALLHDIGKIKIEKNILNKPAKLSELEYKTIQNHPNLGEEMLHNMFSQTNSTIIRNIIDMEIYHHERFDGKGYPYHLKGENIPILARIISVADSIDAMVGFRPYGKSKTKEEVIRDLKENKGSQFDPLIVDSFLSIIDIIFEKFYSDLAEASITKVSEKE